MMTNIVRPIDLSIVIKENFFIHTNLIYNPTPILKR